jgi:chromate transporter
MTLASLTAIALRIGNLTFGGGDPAMAALQRELVDRRRWLTQEDFTLIWSLSRITPGTNVVACFAGVGWRLAGVPGALVITAASCLPAGILCYWLTVAEREWNSNPWVAAALRGIAATVVGMMVAGAALLLKPAWRARALPRALIFTAAAGIAAQAGAPPIAILALAAATGYLFGESR